MFDSKASKADKWLDKLKKLCPNLSDSNIQSMKQELSELVEPKHMSEDTLLNDSENHLTSNSSNENETVGSEANSKREDTAQVKACDEPVKQCSSCHNSKPKSSFPLSQWKLTGRTGSCNECCDLFGPTMETPNKRLRFSSQQSEAQKSTQAESSQCIVGDSQPINTSTTQDTNLSAKLVKPPPPSSSTSNKASLLSIGVDEKNKIHQTSPLASTPSQHQNVKTCFECKQPKPLTEYTASQWKKRVGTGKCITCVSKCPQWQTSSIGSSLQTKACSECNVSKPHTEWSPNQWRKTTGAGRCKMCVDKSLGGAK